MKKTVFLCLLAALLVASAQPLFAHCEVPCGIYNDQMRIDMIREDITTIEKAMKQITALAGQSPVNYNQIVRWTMNKEEHAEKLQYVVQQYFMTQRIKPAQDDAGKLDQRYVDQITLLHMMLIHAMKAKQTTDLQEVETLRSLTDKFSKAYFEGKE
jgi:nickel superoxide dismutase